MAGIGGFVSLLTWGPFGVEVTALSIAAILYSTFRWHDPASGLRLNSIATFPAGYHVNPRDLSHTMIPVCFWLSGSTQKRLSYIAISAIAPSMLDPTAGACFALLALPLALHLIATEEWLPTRRRALPA